ncbi:MAG: hypothetical protein MUP70_16090 [Candidatus Aminicenantes bacterium]|nr:hypothetical protein [Candidatus Aminicenantes bacterium]
MKYQKTAIVFFVLALIGGPIAADSTATQNFSLSVMEVCVLGVTSNPTELVIQAPSEGGETPDDVFDDSTYAVYTSIVGNAQTRNITAQWGNSDAAPAGCSLRLEVTEIGGGNRGSAASEITMSSTPGTIISSIGSCATGTGSSGAKLKYTLSVDTLSSLVAGDQKDVTITLTMTDAS